MANQMLTIGDIAEIFDGPHATPKKIENGPYFLSISSLEDGRLDLSKSAHVSEEQFVKWTKRVTPQKGDLLFSYETRLGEAALMPEGVRACLGRRMGLLRPKLDKVIPEYLLYAYISPFFQQVIKANTIVGATVDRIALSEMKDFPIRVPNLSEQKAACLLLSTIDKKIELNNHINSELESMAKTLYDYWFVQFDFPDANGKPYKASGGKMVYDPTLKRDVPDEWEVTTVGKIATTELGGTPSTTMDEYWNDADIPWLSSAETASFPVTTSEQKITQAGIDNSAATLLPKGTVIISIVRYIRPSILGIDAATNQSVVGIRECKRLKSSFIYPYFCSEVPRLMGLRTGAQQPHINKGVIENSPIVIPSDKALTDYYKVADPIFEKIMNLAFQNQELVQIRDWLLPMLMNGQVTVKPSTKSKEAQHG
ncbi:restriction endonuclease subunit S [Vibrio parahaemolyticus]|uniref:restriction endonuclease subunit S n=1 Tax=Vibrio parahaemolyticus TaxID=670 RepID=UPI000870D0FE|nr:restriction endonuclease subunit S [Vibrio parahaemolyticus]AOV88559.1 Restriction modification system DNA specificity domain [Vibrio parahaemolyticus]EHK9577714.1 restriction endonuclease subunit S [Vibrio parahaemolyticus]EHK9582601.1 restriction endonuclease subunit S [Vibrio parahaemolyticus]EIZ1899977.1 restriction endonuclease subunit S [Vibrio parahaemolyticus]EKO5158812.1 restriction endonuclease subunit S [Vibrio parahaemolyticus]